MIDSVKKIVYRKFNFPIKQDGVTLAVANYSFINFVLKFSGFYIYSDNFSIVNPVLIATLFDAVTYIMINVYTMALYWGDLLKVSFCLVTLGSGFQVNDRVCL
jgi:hypothetical protein